jgi:putative transposase
VEACGKNVHLQHLTPIPSGIQFCLEVLTEALERFGGAEIFSTDQGSQSTSTAFTSALQDAGMRCSMDGRGRCLDNAFIERLWR